MIIFLQRCYKMHNLPIIHTKEDEKEGLKKIKKLMRKEGIDPKIIIQEEISVTQKFIDDTIERYESLPDNYRIGTLGKVLDKKGIIREIKNLSKLGKNILLMDFEFEKYMIKENEEKNKTDP